MSPLHFCCSLSTPLGTVACTARQANLVVSGNQLTGSVPTALQALFPTASSTWSTNCIAGVTSPYLGCDLNERSSLVELFIATNGFGWTARVGWLTPAHPCGWYGVTCGTGSGPVTAIALASNRLNGTLPDAISGLSAMTSFDVSLNTISSTLPTTLYSMSRLVTLSLCSNALSGTLPQAINGLTSLGYDELRSPPRVRVAPCSPRD